LGDVGEMATAAVSVDTLELKQFKQYEDQLVSGCLFTKYFGADR